jgi:hypothetical protein
MTLAELHQTIVHSSDAEERRQALRALLQQLRDGGGGELPAELREFLATHRSEDLVEAALLGLLLRALSPDGEAALATLARIFPALNDPWEPELQRLAVEAFGARSPREVYDQLVDLVGLRQGSDLDRFYAYAVLSQVDHATLLDDAAAYLVER